MGTAENVGFLSAVHVRATYLLYVSNSAVGLPETRGWLRLNSVQLTVKMKTPVKTRTETQCWAFTERLTTGVRVLFEFISASYGELIHFLRHWPI